MNGLPTYRVPPVPTIQGLLYAALGRPSLLEPIQYGGPPTDVRNQEGTFRERVQTNCYFGLRVLNSGIKQTSLRNRHKASKSDNDAPFGTYVAQTETLMAPTYRMYVGGPEDLLTTFAAALQDPERLLYLGRSDDIVDIRDVAVSDIAYRDSEAALDCVIPGPGDGSDPTLLPVEPDHRSGRRRNPARVETVSVNGGTVEGYFETPDGEQFVYLA